MDERKRSLEPPYRFFDVRVDPTAVSEGKTVTPMDYAAEKENEEMISLLAEFTVMPDHIKLFCLSKLMYKGENKAKEKEEFKNLLSSLTVELVSLLHCLACIFIKSSGEQHQCAWLRKSSSSCCG